MEKGKTGKEPPTEDELARHDRWFQDYCEQLDNSVCEPMIPGVIYACPAHAPQHPRSHQLRF